MKTTRRLLMLLLLSSFTLAGCHDDDDFDHTPPAGMGALVIDNRTASDLHLYVDGELIVRIGDDDIRHFDYAPGMYRVILDEDDGPRSWRGDVDVLENRRTIIAIEDGYTSRGGFPAIVYFD